MTQADVAAAASFKGLHRPKIIPFKARTGPVLFKLKYGPDDARSETAPDTLARLMTWLENGAP